MGSTAKKLFLLKTDGIGDFVLASGAIRKLAAEYGEKNLVIAVLPAVAPLAQTEFPLAEIVELDLLNKRKVLNLFLANLFRVAAPWMRLLRMRFDAVLSLRHQRKYVLSFLLFSLRTKRLLLMENTFSSGKKNTRDFVEHFLSFVRRVRFGRYPEGEEFVPLELEAHRRLVSELLGVRVLRREILPSLSVRTREDSHVLLCPASSMAGKDYPVDRWLRVFSQLPPGWKNKEIRLVGSSSQVPELQTYQRALVDAGFTAASVHQTPGLKEFVEEIACAGLVLTVDTAAAHIACALDKRTVIIFSGLHRGAYAPWTRSTRQSWIEPGPAPLPGDGPEPGSKSRWHHRISSRSVLETILANEPV